jgi:hypothetical protein
MADHTGNSQVAGQSTHVPNETDIKRRQPTLDGPRLTFWYPPPTTVQCSHNQCSAKFRAKVWTSAKQSITRHLGDLHDEAESTTIKCVGCEVVLGARPGGHKCGFRIEDSEDVTERYGCNVAGCENSYPSKQGLTNHLRNNRRCDAVELPAPATRQQLRALPRARVTRGGDACVPENTGISSSVVMRPGRAPSSSGPRTLDATNVPDTGGPQTGSPSTVTMGPTDPPTVQRPVLSIRPCPQTPLPPTSGRLSLPRVITPVSPRREVSRNEGYNAVYASPNLSPYPANSPSTQQDESDAAELFSFQK